MNNQQSPILEACVETPQQAYAAEKAGAHRLEYCARLDLDGLTPTLDEIKETLSLVEIPIKVMIRNKPGEFIFNDQDIKDMKKSIDDFQSIGINQYVIGAMNGSSLHLDQIRELVDVNPEAIFTIHKAIDMVKDPLQEITHLKQLPQIRYILTSGQSSTAVGGLEMIRQMMARARPEITIIAAGSITQSNIQVLHGQLGNTDYHGKLIVGQL